MSGEWSSSIESYVGNVSRSDCITLCLREKESSEAVNGVKYGTNETNNGECYCKHDMVDFINATQDYESCFLPLICKSIKW